MTWLDDMKGFLAAGRAVHEERNLLGIAVFWTVAAFVTACFALFGYFVWTVVA